jgi:hypothetical protein
VANVPAREGEEEAEAEAGCVRIVHSNWHSSGIEQER